MKEIIEGEILKALKPRGGSDRPPKEKTIRTTFNLKKETVNAMDKYVVALKFFETYSNFLGNICSFFETLEKVYEKNNEPIRQLFEFAGDLAAYDSNKKYEAEKKIRKTYAIKEDIAKKIGNYSKKMDVKRDVFLDYMIYLYMEFYGKKAELQKKLYSGIAEIIVGALEPSVVNVRNQISKCFDEHADMTEKALTWYDEIIGNAIEEYKQCLDNPDGYVK